MTSYGAIVEACSRWIDRVATTIVAGRQSLRATPHVQLVEQQDGTFAIRGRLAGRRCSICPARRSASPAEVSTPAVAEQLGSLLRGAKVEIVLQPQRFMFRPLELPRRALDFLEGIVRAQIDRLTPVERRGRGLWLAFDDRSRQRPDRSDDRRDGKNADRAFYQRDRRPRRRYRHPIGRFAAPRGGCRVNQDLRAKGGTGGRRAPPPAHLDWACRWRQRASPRCRSRRTPSLAVRSRRNATTSCAASRSAGLSCNQAATGQARRRARWNGTSTKYHRASSPSKPYRRFCRTIPI